MTLRDPRNGRFISEQGYRTLFQPRDEFGHFAREGKPLIQPVQEPKKRDYEEGPGEISGGPYPPEGPTEEGPKEPEEQEWVIEIEVRGTYSD